MFVSYISRSHDDGQQLNVRGLDNPSYEQAIIQNTQSNGNTQDFNISVSDNPAYGPMYN